VLWVVAVALALPLCVAVIRKLQAISMILAELSLPHGGGNPQRYAQRSMLTAVLLFAFSTIFAVALLAMSSALLPPLPVLAVLAAALAYLTYRLWGHFVRVYARAQTALRETFADADAAAADRPLTDLFRRAEVAVVEIESGNMACHRLIRELDLRARTGATIVGIERKGEITMNPSPHDEIAAGDRLLLLGDRQQLDAALALFRGECAA
jgi:CPA2 family monovalent cation:H+ antiporter-2